jgi:Holliday junction resolvasome RuvABC endonuclease subunit
MKIAGLDLSVTSSGVVIEELDENYNIQNLERHGFTTVQKNAILPGLVFYSYKDYRNQYQRYAFLQDTILEWCKDCDYISVEAYALSRGQNGKVFDLAEYEGYIKQQLFRAGKKLRFYPPNQNKKLFAAYGNADKIRMKNALLEKNENKSYGEILLDISDLPPVKDGKKGAAPTSDIIDAFSLCESLRLELRIKNGIESMENQPKHIKEVFISKTDEHPNGLINSDFIYK